MVFVVYKKIDVKLFGMVKLYELDPNYALNSLLLIAVSLYKKVVCYGRVAVWYRFLVFV